MMQTKELEAYLEASNYMGRYSNTTHDCSCSGNAAAPIRTVTPVRSNVVSSNNVTNPIIPRGATAENTVTPAVRVDNGGSTQQRSNVTTSAPRVNTQQRSNVTTSAPRVNAPVQTPAVRVDNGGNTQQRSNVTTSAPRVNAPVQTPAVRVDNGGNTPQRSNIDPNPIVVVPPVNQTPIVIGRTGNRTDTTTNPGTPGNGTNNPTNPGTPGNGTNNPTNPGTPGNGTNNPTNPGTPGNGTNNPTNPTDPYQPPTVPTDFPGAATGLDPLPSGGSGDSGMPIDTGQPQVDQNGVPVPITDNTAKAGNWLLAALAVGTLYMMIKKKKVQKPRTVKL